MALIVASQIFYLGLSFTALAKMQQESRLVLETYVADHLGRQLDTVATLGLGLDRYTTLPASTAEAADRAAAEFLFVTDQNGRLLAGRAPDQLFQPPGLEGKTGVFTFQEVGRPWLGRAITSPTGDLAAYIFISRDRFDSQKQAWETFQKHRPTYLTLNLLSILILVALVASLFQKIKTGQPVGRRRMLFLFLTPFLLAQLGFMALSLGDIFEKHLEDKRAAARQLARFFSSDLEKISNHGLDLRDIADLEPYLGRLLSLMPALESLAVFDQPVTQPLAKTKPSPKSLNQELLVSQPFQLNGLSNGRVEARLSAAVLSRERLSLILDNLALTLAAGLLFMELARLLAIKLEAGTGPAATWPVAGGQTLDYQPWVPPDQVAVIRPIVFLTLMALDFSLSFLPLKMLNFQGPFWGLSQKVICSLPISLELGLTGLLMLAGGFWARRLGGWRPLFLAGLMTLAGGYLLSGLAQSPGLFIAARGLAGAGYGLFNIAAQIFIVTNYPPGRQGEALASLFASFFAGGLCGCAAGGLLADRFGFDLVFYSSAAIFLALAGLTLFCLPGGSIPNRAQAPRPAAWASFWRSGPVWRFVLLAVLPLALTLTGLINYFLPLHLNNLGAGPALIGQLYALFSLLVIVLGPWAGRRLDHSSRPFLLLVRGGLMATLAFPLLVIWPTLAGVCFGLVCLGLADAIAEGGQPAYLLNLPATKPVGEETVLSFFNAVSKLGQALGPLAVAGVWSLGGLEGLLALSLLFFLATILFWGQARRTSSQ